MTRIHPEFWDTLKHLGLVLGVSAVAIACCVISILGPR
jgi:hypothetical protein